MSFVPLTSPAVDLSACDREPIHVPGSIQPLDGLQVLECIKGNIELRQIPVVMLASSREEQDLLRSYRLGVNAYVVKQVGFQEFMQVVQEVGGFWAVLNEPPPGSARARLV